jgi:GT2 family glycosyltransferase
MTPAVSVIIPTHNRFSLLQEAVASVFAQTTDDYELIVVDDGSTDETPSIEATAGLCYRRIHHSGRPGLVRNRGVDLARGEWIAFLDSDDLWMTTKLTKSLRRLHECPDAALVHTRERWMRNGRQISQKGQRHQREGDVFADSLRKCIIGPSTVVIPREVFTRVGGFREDLEVAEDYELWLRIVDTAPVAYVEEPLTTKRAGHGDQLSERYGKIELFRIRALRDLVDRNAFTAEHRPMAQEELSRKCRIYAAGCRTRGRSAEAAEYEALARRYGSQALL